MAVHSFHRRCTKPFMQFHFYLSTDAVLLPEKWANNHPSLLEVFSFFSIFVPPPKMMISRQVRHSEKVICLILTSRSLGRGTLTAEVVAVQSAPLHTRTDVIVTHFIVVIIILVITALALIPGTPISSCLREQIPFAQNNLGIINLQSVRCKTVYLSHLHLCYFINLNQIHSRFLMPWWLFCSVLWSIL